MVHGLLMGRDQGLAELLGSYNATVLERSTAALEAGDAQALGELMTESQAAFDRFAMPACPEQLTAPVSDCAQTSHHKCR